MAKQPQEPSPAKTPAMAPTYSNEADDTDRRPGASTPERLDFLAAAEGPNEIGRLAHYRVLRVLGKGGMGLVLLAEDTQLERQVALKVMLPRYAENANSCERFLREAKAAAKIKHDHVITIFQVGQDRGIPFIAMEYLQGAPLDHYLKAKGELGIQQVVRVGREIALGLQAAHQKGLIHRDIKPGNIWLESPKGRVKILDFGLARREADDVHITQDGAIVGTPAYMSPEQAQALEVDARCDLFSLGVVLYRLATGEIPFAGKTTMAILSALAMVTPKLANEVNAKVPVEMARIIAQLLQKEPNDRYPNAQEFLKDWDQLAKALLSGKPAETSLDVQASDRPNLASPMPTMHVDSHRTKMPTAATSHPTHQPATPMPTVHSEAEPRKPKRSKRKAAAARRWYLYAGGIAATVLLVVATVLICVLAFRGRDNERVEGLPPVSPPPLNPAIPKQPPSKALPLPSEWTPLFNGRDLAGWKTLAGDYSGWSVEAGELVGRGTASTMLFSEASHFGDFHLRAEVMVNAAGNSGIIFRSPFAMFKHEKFESHAAYEAELRFGQQGAPLGTLWNGKELAVIAKAASSTAAADQWFKMELIARGPRLQVSIDSQPVVDFTDTSFAHRKGHVALQSLGAATAVRFKSIEIKELPALSPKEGAFVVVARSGGQEQRYPTLATAIVAAQPGEIIEIRGNGPFASEPILITGKPLSIRAGKGFQPRIEWARGASANDFFVTDAPLFLEGISLDVSGKEAAAPGTPASGAILRIQKAPLHITHCRIVGNSDWASAISCSGDQAMTLENSQLHGTFTGVSLLPHGKGKSAIVNNVLTARSHVVWLSQFSAPVIEDVAIVLRNNTILGGIPINYAVESSLPKLVEERPKAPYLKWFLSGNLMCGTTPFFFNPTDAATPVMDAVGFLPKLASLQDTDNVYACDNAHFLAVNRKEEPNSMRVIDSLADWYKFWGIDKSRSLVGAVKFERFGLRERIHSVPKDFGPSDFRLQQGSVGKQMASGGKDLGADLDQVGPGEAYEKWLKSTESREWRTKSETLVAQAAVNATAFVVLEKPGRSESRHASLAAAVKVAAAGDVVEIRGDGPFLSDTVEITRPLHIRAGPKSRPAIHFLPSKGGFGCLRCKEAVTLEGIELAYLTRPATSPTTFIAGNKIQLANCRVISAQDAHVFSCSALDAVHCEFISTRWSGVSASGKTRLRLENCILAGGSVLLVNPRANADRYEIDLVRSSLLGNGSLSVRFTGIVPTPEPGAAMIQVRATNSILPGILLSVDNRHVSTSLNTQEGIDLMRRLVRWTGTQNLYYGKNMFHIAENREGQKFKSFPLGLPTLADWEKAFESKEPDALTGAAQYQGGDVLLRLRADPRPLAMKEYRLVKGSPGQGALPGGRDVGAEVDLVGPGAYEKCQSLPAYQEWRKRIASSP